MTFSSLFTATSNVSRITTARADLASAGIDTADEILAWYTAFGKNETDAQGKIDLVNGIDESYLLTLRPDVAAAVTSGAFLSATHWYLSTSNDGLAANVAPSASFSASAYLSANSDVSAAGFTAANVVQHFIRFGAAEGRAADGSGTTSTSTTGTTFSLTNNTTTGAVDNLTGTANNDTFSASADGLLTTGDVIAGAAGTDTLTSRHTVTAATSIAPTATAVEVHQVRLDHDGGAADVFTYDMSDVSGATDVIMYRAVNSGATGDAVFTVSGSGLTTSVAVGITGGDTGANNSAVDFTATFQSVTGTTDSATLKLNGAAANVVTIDGIETLNIVATATETTAVTTGASELNSIIANDATSVVITGAGAVDLSGDAGSLVAVDFAATVTIDASANTGGVDFLAETSTLTFTGGSGDDYVRMAGTYTSADSLAFGTGTDTLSMNVASLDPSTAPTNISGLERIAVADDASNDTIDGGKFGVNYVIIEVDSATLPVIENLTTGATIDLGVNVDNFGGTTDADINNSDAAGGGDAITIDINNTAGAGNIDIDLEGIEAITINTVDSDQANDVAIASSTMTDFDLSIGTGLLTLSFASGGTAVSSVDASSSTSTGGLNVTLNTASVVSATVTGTSNADDVADGNQADTITLGAGADIFSYSAGGADAVDMGNDSDADQVEIDAVDLNTWGATITNFDSGEDVLDAVADTVDDSVITVTAARAAAALDDNDIIVFEQTAGSAGSLTSGGSEAIADFTDMTDVEAFLDEQFTIASNDTALILLNDGTNSYLYFFLEGDGATSMEADELVLVSTFSSVVIDADDVTVTT